MLSSIPVFGHTLEIDFFGVTWRVEAWAKKNSSRTLPFNTNSLYPAVPGVLLLHELGDSQSAQQ